MASPSDTASSTHAVQELLAGLLNELAATSAVPQLIDWTLVVESLVLAFALGVVVSQTYRITNRELVHSQKLMQSLVVIAGVVCTITMVVGDHLAVAFALVGVLGVIRLRAVVGNSREFIYLLMSLAAGIGTGSADTAGHLGLTAAGVIAACGTAYLLWRAQFGSHRAATYTAKICAPAS